MFQSPVCLLIWFFFFSQRSRAASLSECLQQDTDVSEAVHRQCQWVVCISLSCLLPPFWTGVGRPVLQSWFHCSDVLAIALSFRYHYWLRLYSTLPCSWADSMRSCHMWLWMSLVLYGVFWMFTEWCPNRAVWLLHSWFHLKLLLSWCIFCVHHTTMHQFTVLLHLKPHTLGACVFSCNLLPPALFAEWQVSFVWYSSNLVAELMPKSVSSEM